MNDKLTFITAFTLATFSLFNCKQTQKSSEKSIAALSAGKENISSDLRAQICDQKNTLIDQNSSMGRVQIDGIPAANIAVLETNVKLVLEAAPKRVAEAFLAANGHIMVMGAYDAKKNPCAIKGSISESASLPVSCWANDENGTPYIYIFSAPDAIDARITALIHSYVLPQLAYMYDESFVKSAESITKSLTKDASLLKVAADTLASYNSMRKSMAEKMSKKYHQELAANDLASMK